VDVDGNRYVDLAAGFGALLLGHGHPSVLRAIELQAPRLLQALGDLYPSDAKIALADRLMERFPGRRVIFAQSGSDAVTAALKSALLATGRPGVLAFEGAYHGLGYAPLAACGLRSSYRAPFAEQLGHHVRFVEAATDRESAARALEATARCLRTGEVGAVLVEPVLGRGGCLPTPPGFLAELHALTRSHGSLLVADEIWTGLGRGGAWSYTEREGVRPELLVLGKGLGGGLPIAACLGDDAVMQAWSRDEEVVHTSTFAGAPLAASTAIATLGALERERLPERAEALGAAHRTRLTARVGERVRAVTGVGLMTGIALHGGAGAASRVMRALLERGFITSTGGGSREVLVLTPPLGIAEPLLEAFDAALSDVLDAAP
jgi:4-aminobutyrate aminotransferase / (S)-3-amino-2-methylpropionate transaminase / 5-aminovalerate transaminase